MTVRYTKTDLSNYRKDDTMRFLRLLEPQKWEKLRRAVEEKADDAKIQELVTELMEGEV